MKIIITGKTSYIGTNVKAFFEENKEFFENSRIQKIQSPSRKDLIFYLRGLGETRKFYININPQFYHICFKSKENEAKLNLEIPKQPTMFCMLLRKYIENGKIAKVNVPEYERIFEIFIESSLHEKESLAGIADIL